MSLSRRQPRVQSTFTCDITLSSPPGSWDPPLRCSRVQDPWTHKGPEQGGPGFRAAEATGREACTTGSPSTNRGSVCLSPLPPRGCAKKQSIKISASQSSCSQHATAQAVPLVPTINLLYSHSPDGHGGAWGGCSARQEVKSFAVQGRKMDVMGGRGEAPSRTKRPFFSAFPVAWQAEAPHSVPVEIRTEQEAPFPLYR